MQYGVIQVLEPEEAEKIRKILEVQEWKEGLARTKELTGFIKRNKELKPGEGNPIVDKYSQDLCNATMQCMPFQRATHPKHMMAYKFNLYGADQPGGEYRAHTDAPWMGKVRTDFTMVLALTDPDDYEGGDHWVTPPNQEPMCFRPKQGELMFYETGYKHWVEPVTKGSRISALSWAESNIQSERKRALCTQLLTMSHEFEAGMYDEELSDEMRDKMREWFVGTGVVHSGLQRMWANRG